MSRKGHIAKRILSLLLTVTLMLELIPASAMAAGMDRSLVSSLAEFYGGDAQRAEDDLEALYEAGIIDEQGNMVRLDIRENGQYADLDDLAGRIADGEITGDITVNGNAATPEQITQISQVNASLELIRLLDQDVEITDEHVENLKSLVGGIADGSIDVDRAIEEGELSMDMVRDTVDALNDGDGTDGQEQSTIVSTGNVTVDSNGKYTQPMIDGSTYDASHAFTLLDPTNKAYYVDSRYNGMDASGIVTLSCDNSIAAGGTVVVTATLSKALPYPVSFDWKAGGDVDIAVGEGDEAQTVNSVSGTVSWAANDTKNKTITIQLSKDEADLWDGSRILVINASNIKNAAFADGKATWNKNVAVTATDGNTIRSQYTPQTVNVGTGGLATRGTSTTYVYGLFDWPEVYPFDLQLEFRNSCKNGNYFALKIPNGAITGTTPSTEESSYAGFRQQTSISGYSFTARITADRSDCKSTNGKGVFKIDFVSPSNNSVDQVQLSYAMPPNSVTVTGISIPEGNYYSGEIVPITVTFDNYVCAKAATKLTVNGVECSLLDAANTETKKLTFGYTVKDVDTGAVNVTAISGIKNSADKDVNLGTSDQVVVKSFGADESVSLVSTALKTGSIDWANAKYGISDVMGLQTVTVMLPLTSGDLAWVTGEAVKYNTGKSIVMALPDHSTATADYYLPGAYFSCDGGANRYPVYVAEDGSNAFLVGRFTVPVNETPDLRYDTLNLFMASEVLSPETGAEDITKYLPAWSEAQTAGDPFDGTGKPYANPVTGKSWSYYVAGCTFFESAEHVERTKSDYVTSGDEYVIYESELATGYKFIHKTADQEGYVLLQDPEHPENQYDVEVVANQVFMDGFTGGVRMEAGSNPQLSLQFSNRKTFSFKEPSNFTWTSSDENIAKLVVDTNGIAHVVFTGPTDGEVSFNVAVKNGIEERSYTLDASKLIALAGKDPYLNIPEYSQNIETLTNTSTDVLFASNITARNAALSKPTTFTASLYNTTNNDGDYVKTGEAIWTNDFTSTTDATLTHITVPGTELSEAGIYVVEIATSYFGGPVHTVETAPNNALSASAFITVKPGPASIKLNDLDSYSILSSAVPAGGFGYTVTPESATVQYTIQKSGEAVGARQTPGTSGKIPFTPEEIIGLKDVYTITVYARNSEEDDWSVDSMLLTVYNADALDIIVKDVTAGEIGGTTGGSITEGVTSVKGTSLEMDNHGKLTAKYGITTNNENSTDYQLTFTDFNILRTDMSLQKIISANYGSGVWGLLSDKIEWESSKPDLVSLNYKQGGIYSDLRNYSYTSYAPATDLLLVGKDETGTNNNVTIKATHANTGMEATFTVSATTLENQLYMFQFMPKAVTTVVYTNGYNDTRTLTSNANGELAVYEPSGIKSTVKTMSTKGDVTYVGTIFPEDLVSGEKDIASLQLYPCNNVKLRAVGNANLTLLKPDGTPYNGAVTLRAGVYKNGVYCPSANVALADDGVVARNGRQNISATVNNGKLLVRFDPTQFKHNPSDTNEHGLQPGEKATYIIEYRFADDLGYRPGYVQLDVAGDFNGEHAAKDSMIQIYRINGTMDQPQISKQVIHQYYNDGTNTELTPTGYTRDVTGYTENIGVSPSFSETKLFTSISLPGETVAVDAQTGYATSTSQSAYGISLCNATNEHTLTGQINTAVNAETPAVLIDDLNKLEAEDTKIFVFPFSSIAMMQSTYTMTNENLTADGITDAGASKNPTVRVRANVIQGDMTVRVDNLPFGVSNLTHQKDPAREGGPQVANEIKQDISGRMDIGNVFGQVNVNSMLQKGFTFLNKLNGNGEDSGVSMVIMPTEDPATFRIVVLVGREHDENDEDGNGVSVNYDPNALAEDLHDFEEELENMSKDDDKPNNGEGKIEFSFSGMLLLTAKCDIVNNEWDIAFTGGSVGTSVSGSYKYAENFMCGPVPFFVQFEAGFGARLNISFVSKDEARAMLLDATLNMSLRAFAGLGFDLSVVAFKLGIEGNIGASANFKYLTQTGAAGKTGTKLNINGSIGIKMEVKVLLVSYSTTFASTGFGWSKSYGQYDAIERAWRTQGFAEIFGVTRNGRAYSMQLTPYGTGMIAIEGAGEIENRDYLDMYERAWKSGVRLRGLRSAPAAMTDIQDNAYPYSDPVFTDDGSMFLYISDNNNADELQSVVSYATGSGTNYTNQGALYATTAEGAVLADSDVVASGSGENVFAAWVKQLESPEKEMHAATTIDDLGMMMNATEIYSGIWNGSAWTVSPLTDNKVADMAPTVASYGNKAIVAWRSMKAASLPDDADFTNSFNVENCINYKIYNGTGWTSEAVVAYNGSAGTVNAIDSAMLSDGTAILVYTVRTGTAVTSTEAFYTVIGADGNVLTTGRLTNDDNTDTNVQVSALNTTDPGNHPHDGQFIIGWYSEYAIGEEPTGGTAGEGASSEPQMAHDIRLAAVNANGSVDDTFPESLSGTDITTDFHFSAPADNNDLRKLSIIWPQSKDSDAAGDEGKYELNAVRFYIEGDAIGVTAQTVLGVTPKYYTVDHYDSYTAGDGKVYALVLGSDYSTTKGVSVFDSIDLTNLPVESTLPDQGEDGDPNVLNVLQQTVPSSIKLATGSFATTDIEAEANFDIMELMPGLELPIQFTVTNTGTSKITDINVKLGSGSESVTKPFNSVNLLPNESTVLTTVYEVPEGAVSNIDYSVTADSVEASTSEGTLNLNRPDVGIAEMKLIREDSGTRDIQVRLSNDSDIPLSGSGKTVKLAFYKDSMLREPLGEEITITSGTDLESIDEDVYTYVKQNIDVREFIGEEAEEIPDEGITVYAKAWVVDTDELYTSNNTSSLNFEGLYTKYRTLITKDVVLLNGDTLGNYTINASIRNNSLQNTDLGEVTVDILDIEGHVLKTVTLQNDNAPELTKEQIKVYEPKNITLAEGTPVTAVIHTEADNPRQTLTASDVTATYGDTNKSVSVRSNVQTTFSYAVKEGSEDYIDVDATGKLTIKKTGTAYVIVTAARTDDYSKTKKTVTITVEQKEITVKAKDQSILINEEVPDITTAELNTNYTVTGLVGEDQLTTPPTLTYSEVPDNTQAGTYTITPSGAAASSNYTINYETGTLTIRTQSSGGGGTTPGTLLDVQFDMNGHGNTNIERQSVESGEKLVRPEDPVDDKYDFAGWFTDEACTTEYDFDTAVTENLILYAKWTERTTPSGDLESIIITTPPAKKDYKAGELFDPTGMTVTAYYTKGGSKEVTEYTYRPDGALSARDTKITISYTENGITCTNKVNVTVTSDGTEQALMNSISVDSQPAKLTYTAGEKFDPAGMIIKATFIDGTTREISDYTYTPAGKLRTDDTAITITYTVDGITCRTTIPITVNKSGTDPEPPLPEGDVEVWNLFESDGTHEYTIYGVNAASVQNSNTKSSAYYTAVLNGDTISVSLKNGVNRKKAANKANSVLSFVLEDGSCVEYTLPVTYEMPSLKLKSTSSTIKSGAESTVENTILTKVYGSDYEPMDLTGAKVTFDSKDVDTDDNGRISFKASSAVKGKISVSKPGWEKAIELNYTLKAVTKDVFYVDTNGVKTLIVNSNAKEQSFEYPVYFNGNPADQVSIEDKKNSGLASYENGKLTIAYPSSGIKAGTYTIALRSGEAKCIVKVKVSNVQLSKAVKLDEKRKYDVVTGSPMVLEPVFKNVAGTITDVSVDQDGFEADLDDNGNIIVNYEGNKYDVKNLKIGTLKFKLGISGIKEEVEVTLKKIKASKTTPVVKAASVTVPKNASGEVIATANIICTYKGSDGKEHNIAPVSTAVGKVSGLEAKISEQDPLSVNVTKLNKNSASVKVKLTFKGGLTKTITIKVKTAK